jgi:hypothetical protein
VLMGGDGNVTRSFAPLGSSFSTVLVGQFSYFSVLSGNRGFPILHGRE